MKKNLRRNGTEFTQKCFDIVSLVSMDCFLIVNIIIFQVSREYLLWKERFQWFCTTITTTTILYVFSENSWIKTITTTKIELKLYKKHITLSAEHKNANVFCTAYEFISLFFFLFVSYSTTTKSGVWMIFGGKYAHCFEKKKKWRKIKKCHSIFFTLFMGISRIEQHLICMQHFHLDH